LYLFEVYFLCQMFFSACFQLTSHYFDIWNFMTQASLSRSGTDGCIILDGFIGFSRVRDMFGQHTEAPL